MAQTTPSTNPSDASLGVAPASPGSAPGPIATQGIPPAPGTPAPAARPDLNIFMIMIPLLLLMIIMSVMSGRKEKKKREALMSNLAKHDVVQTIGGVIGTVAELGEHEVVLKLEEGRVRVTRGAIQNILRSSSHKHEGTAEPKPAATVGAR